MCGVCVLYLLQRVVYYEYGNHLRPFPVLPSFLEIGLDIEHQTLLNIKRRTLKYVYTASPPARLDVKSFNPCKYGINVWEGNLAFIISHL